ncbi:monooxygenase [Enhygromyxa salina]|uniref:monooxygenase n=1 Tax=Enhygromyxa salina TaxID=215803 RepID=UPI0015E5BB36|nr:hypothetical protein [Enhygromyxa salina]
MGDTETDGGDGDGDTGDGDGDTGDGDTGDGDPGEDLQRWEIRMPDFSPPAIFPTYYSCYAQTIEVPADVHIVGFEPKISDPHVHHIVAQMLDTPTVDNPIDPCLEEPWDDMIWGWAPGGENLYLPPEAGIRAGVNGTVTVRFQVHYDNPLNQSFTDSGGFDVLFTDQLRPNDAAIATFGDIGPIFIPANDPAHEHVASCPSSFTSSNFPGPLNVVATWLHAHDIGSVLWGEVVPQGGGPAFELGREDPYVFDNQTFTLAPEGTVLMPGDEVRTHCVYDNSGNNNPVHGGPETKDEMCINFVLYYPKSSQFNECGSL